MIDISIKNVNMQFETSQRLFSPGKIDAGTLAMLETLNFRHGDKVLDLGCGYGVVGILAAKIIGSTNVVMSDIDAEALSYARKNALRNGVGDVKIINSNGFTAIHDVGFTHIICNPPYHVDFSVPKHFIEKGFNRLCLAGKLIMVTRRKEWYKNKLTAIFGGTRIIESKGYYIFTSEKRSFRYARSGSIPSKP